MGSDRSIAEAAWVSSYDKNRREERSDEDVENLVIRLARDGHSTPFESVVFRFWMRFPIFTDRQVMTHRIASHNGLSGRYRTLPDDWFKIPKDCEEILGKVSMVFMDDVVASYEKHCEMAYGIYNANLQALRNAEKRGVVTNAEYKRVREILRGMLPTAGMTERVTSLNLRSFANFQRLRGSSHAQPEIRGVANQMLDQVVQAKICPRALSALSANGWVI